MPSLHIFNPETDYALASGLESYTPPSGVREIRMANALVPAAYANEGDVILLADEPRSDISDLYCYDIAQAKRLRILTKNQARRIKDEIVHFTPCPWGWNPNIRKFFINTIGDMPGLPSSEIITDIRKLSHRRTAAMALQLMSSEINPDIEIPVEIDSSEEAMKYVRKGMPLYFKAPWSSSGRGVICTDGMSLPQIEKWIYGIVRRQGSVMMEKAYKRSLDFATEWICSKGEPIFTGFSIFNVLENGKYLGNVSASQDKLYNIISASTPDIEKYISLQRETLKTLIASHYDGPVGIDMLVTASGAVNPCVEINLRHTMGMVQLHRAEFFETHQNLLPYEN